jgi:hypothetical protein
MCSNLSYIEFTFQGLLNVVNCSGQAGGGWNTWTLNFNLLLAENDGVSFILRRKTSWSQSAKILPSRKQVVHIIPFFLLNHTDNWATLNAKLSFILLNMVFLIKRCLRTERDLCDLEAGMESIVLTSHRFVSYKSSPGDMLRLGNKYIWRVLWNPLLPYFSGEWISEKA